MNKVLLVAFSVAVLFQSALQSGDIDKMIADAKQAKLVYSETINLSTYAGYSGYSLKFDKKCVVVFYYNADAEENISQIWADFYNPKDDSIASFTTTNIPKYKGDSPDEVRFEGFFGKFIVARFHYPASGKQSAAWQISSFVAKKGALEKTDGNATYSNKSLTGIPLNGKIYVKFTDETDKKYVAKLDMPLKKASVYTSSTDKIEELGSQTKEDYWFEDYTNAGGDMRFIKVYKL